PNCSSPIASSCTLARSIAASRSTAKSRTACKVSSSIRSRTASPSAWPFFISAGDFGVSATVIRNGRVIDPANKRDEVVDLAVVDGRIAERSQIRDQKSEIDEIDATNLIVAPGLIDIHVHLREPGFGHKETIESGARAAAAGGFTTIVCMPNTSPGADNPSTIAWIRD